MPPYFIIYLVILWLSATIAIIAPGVILAGLVLGVLPGIFLALSPTLLMYSLLWWPIQAALVWVSARLDLATGRSHPELLAGIVALLALLPLVFIITWIPNRSGYAASMKLRSEDKNVAGLIPLPDTILYRNDEAFLGRHPTCDDVCLRLLYNGAVKRVMLAHTCAPTNCSEPYKNSIFSFWIEHHENCNAFRWHRVGDTRFPIDQKPRKTKALYFEFIQKRMANGECVVSGIGNLTQPMLMLSLEKDVKRTREDCEWCLTANLFKVDRIEVHGRGGEILYRRTEVERYNLQFPLLIDISINGKTGWRREKQIDTPIGDSGAIAISDIFGEAISIPAMPNPVLDR